MSTALPSHELVDESVFRHVASHFATGVTIITTSDDDGPAGTTASAVASLSMDPPMMLICLNRSSATHDRVLGTGRFGVNILAEHQGTTALTFARQGADRFAEAPWVPARNGVPFLEGSLANIACRVVETAVGGTHTVFLGEVVDAEAHDAKPLTYYRGGFGRFEEDADARTYRAVREHVLQRLTGAGDALDLDEITASLRVRPASVEQALTRLVAEGLVSRADDGSVTVTPLTPELAEGFFAAQAAIELGIVDMHVRQAPDDAIERISAAGDTLRAVLHADSSADLTAQLTAIKTLHRELIALSPSPQLAAAYNELSTEPLWAALLPEGLHSELLDSHTLLSLVDAVATRDTAEAREAIRAHVTAVGAIARREILARGGAV